MTVYCHRNLNNTIIYQYFVRMRSENNQNMIVRQSTKSLAKIKSAPLEERVLILSNQLLSKPNQTPKLKQYKSHIHKPPKKSQEELINRINLLQNLLKKRINEDGILRNFFKTLNTSKLSHIDIYLELKKCEEIIEPLKVKLQQESQKSVKYQMQMLEIQKQIEKRQMSHSKNLMNAENDWAQSQRKYKKQCKQLNQTIQQLQSEVNTHRLLIVEFKRKNQLMIEETKALNKKHQQQVRQLNESSRKARKQFEKQIIEIEQQKQNSKSQIQLLKRKNNDLSSQIEILYTSKNLNQRMKQVYQQSQLKIEKLIRVQQQKQEQIVSISKQLDQKNIMINNLLKQTQQLTISCQEQISFIQQKFDSLKINNAYLQEQNRTLLLQVEKYKNANTQNSTQITKLTNSISNYQKQIAALRVEQNRQKFKQTDLKSLAKKYQVQKEQQQRMINKLQKKVKDITHTHELLCKKYEQIKKQNIHMKSYEQINEAIYCQSYKAGGRLMEIGNQVVQLLMLETSQHIEQILQQQQSLQAITSYLTRNIQLLLCQFRKKINANNRIQINMQLRMKQVSTIFNHVKKITGIQGFQLLINKYKNSNIQNYQNEQDLSQIYHSIIQRLISAENGKGTIIEDSLNTVRDSLENVEVKELRKGEQINKQNIDINQIQKLSEKEHYQKMINFQGRNIQNRQGYQAHVKVSSIRNQIERKYFR